MPPKGTRPPVIPVPAPAMVTGVFVRSLAQDRLHFRFILRHVHLVRMAAETGSIFKIRRIQSDLEDHGHDQRTPLRLLVQKPP